MKLQKLELLPKNKYVFEPRTDPLQYYYWPILENAYRRRVELALNECSGGHRILEVGFGSGITFLNLKKVYDEIHGIDLFADVEKVSSMWKSQGVKTYLKQGNVMALDYADGTFDTVLLISILEHIHPEEQIPAFREIKRVLKPGGQVVYGVPVERNLMVFAFNLLGHNIRDHHFSTQDQVREAASREFAEQRVLTMTSQIPFVGPVYQIGHFTKHL